MGRVVEWRLRHARGRGIWGRVLMRLSAPEAKYRIRSTPAPERESGRANRPC